MCFLLLVRGASKTRRALRLCLVTRTAAGIVIGVVSGTHCVTCGFHSSRSYAPRFLRRRCLGRLEVRAFVVDAIGPPATAGIGSTIARWALLLERATALAHLVGSALRPIAVAFAAAVAMPQVAPAVGKKGRTAAQRARNCG